MVVVEKFKEIYKLAEELQMKYSREEYECLKRTDTNIGTFEEYLDNQIQKTNVEVNKDDSIILKDTIKKENLIVNTYLMKFKQIEPVQLDDDYKVLPLEEKIMYQYGSILTMPIEEGFIDINDVFSNYVSNEEQAKDEYTKLKNKLEKLSGDELLREFKSAQAKVRSAVEAMISEADKVASGNGEFYSYDDIFSSEE